MPYYREKGPGVQGKRWLNTGTALLALRLGVVLYVPSNFWTFLGEIKKSQGNPKHQGMEDQRVAKQKQLPHLPFLFFAFFFFGGGGGICVK